MVEFNIGLTKTYNRFHDPHETSPGILKLRELHEAMDRAMDRAVLRAYGCDDLAEAARCEFLLDYEEDDDDAPASGEASARRAPRKKPWRLRWPDEFRDEVLARLLELNEQRHQEEFLQGAAAQPAPKTKARTKKSKSADPQPPLWGE